MVRKFNFSERHSGHDEFLDEINKWLINLKHMNLFYYEDCNGNNKTIILDDIKPLLNNIGKDANNIEIILDKNKKEIIIKKWGNFSICEHKIISISNFKKEELIDILLDNFEDEEELNEYLINNYNAKLYKLTKKDLLEIITDYYTQEFFTI